MSLPPTVARALECAVISPRPPASWIGMIGKDLFQHFWLHDKAANWSAHSLWDGLLIMLMMMATMICDQRAEIMSSLHQNRLKNRTQTQAATGNTIWPSNVLCEALLQRAECRGPSWS